MNRTTLVILAIIGFFLFIRLKKIIGYIAFSGFMPYKNNKLWAIKDLLAEIKQHPFDPDKPIVIRSINAGPAGFLGAVAQVLPRASLVAVQQKRRRYVLDALQLLFRKRVKLLFTRNAYSLYLKDANVIYVRLQPDTLLELVKKFKYECAPGTLLISSQVPVPNMVEKRIFNAPPVIKQGRFTLHKKTSEELKKLASVRAEMHYLYEI
jgi:hypothetical protein